MRKTGMTYEQILGVEEEKKEDNTDSTTQASSAA